MLKLFPKIIAPFILIGAMILLTTSVTPAETQRISSPSKSVASLGDSITQAANACNPWEECPEVSWATGTKEEEFLFFAEPPINSIAMRIANLSKGVGDKIKVYNNARSYSKSDDLINQATLAVTQKPEFVTILTGSNDICMPSLNEITTDEQFRTNIANGLNVLSDGLPKTKIYVTSIPNIYNLWEVAKDNNDALTKWSTASLCGSMLENASSMSEEDQTRRIAVKTKIETFNSILQEECLKTKNCLHDNNRIFNTQFTTEDISPVDYFHPSLEGQNKLAENAWGFDVAIHAFIDRGVSKRSSDEAPIVTPVAPVDGEILHGEKYLAIAEVEGEHKIERVYADTQIGGVDMAYDKKTKQWVLELDTTLAPNGLQTFFTIVAVDEEGGIAISEKISVKVDNTINPNIHPSLPPVVEVAEESKPDLP